MREVREGKYQQRIKIRVGIVRRQAIGIFLCRQEHEETYCVKKR